MVLGGAHGLARGQPIDLQHQTVYVVGELRPGRGPLFHVLRRGGRIDHIEVGRLIRGTRAVRVISDDHGGGVDAKPEPVQVRQQPGVRGRRVGHEALIHEDLQRHGGDVAALHPPQAAGREVACVGVRRLHAGVERVERRTPDEDFAPHGQRLRGGEPQRHRADGPHVLGHVVAAAAVAAGDRPFQHALAVVQQDGGAVDLLLNHEGGIRVRGSGLVHPALDAGHVVRLVQAQHRHGVLDLGELLGQVGADPAGRRVRSWPTPGTAVPAPRGWRTVRRTRRRRSPAGPERGRRVRAGESPRRAARSPRQPGARLRVDRLCATHEKIGCAKLLSESLSALTRDHDSGSRREMLRSTRSRSGSLPDSTSIM